MKFERVASMNAARILVREFQIEDCEFHGVRKIKQYMTLILHISEFPHFVGDVLFKGGHFIEDGQ